MKIPREINALLKPFGLKIARIKIHKKTLISSVFPIVFRKVFRHGFKEPQIDQTFETFLKNVYRESTLDLDYVECKFI